MRRMIVVLGLVLTGLAISMATPPSLPQTTVGAGTRGNGPRGGIPMRPLPAIDGVTERGAGIYRIEESRPVHAAAYLLERKFRVPISYEEEDPVFAGDQVFAAELPGNSVSAAGYPEWKGPRVPRNQSFDLTLPFGLALRQIGDPTLFILEALESHKRNRNVGEFKLVPVGDYGFSIVMEKLADKSGTLQLANPPLDTRVSFPARDRTVLETINLIASLTKAGSTEGPSGPPQGFTSPHGTTSANDEVARDVLARILKIPGYPKYSWSRTTITGFGAFLLFSPVRVERVLDDGSSVPEDLVWPQK